MGPISVKPLERSFNLNCAIIRPGVIMSNSPVLSSVRSILLSPRGFSPLASATARLETGAVHVLLVSRLRMRSHVYVRTCNMYIGGIFSDFHSKELKSSVLSRFPLDGQSWRRRRECSRKLDGRIVHFYFELGETVAVQLVSFWSSSFDTLVSTCTYFLMCCEEL